MKRKSFILFFVLAQVFFLLQTRGDVLPNAYNPNPPPSTVKLIFIHHSCGENWLADWDGGLGLALRNNSYFVSDTNYGWGPDSIGDLTDIGHWWLWFCGSNSTTCLDALYTESTRSWDFYSRLLTDPGGENEIILFKSCYPNSHLSGNPNDSPTSNNNPLRGQDCWSEHHTVANAKGIYNDLLTYFATRRNKLFFVITAPPLVENDTDTEHAANARALNNWLVNDWLDSYSYHNVSVFDFYNILTSNGGNSNTTDSAWETGNHHRWWNNDVQHIQTVDRDTAAYPTDEWDSHPNSVGNQKATDEFIEFLNIHYHCWKGTGDCPNKTVSNQPPVIDSFTASLSSATSPLIVNFTCTAHDPDGSITEYRWDFNNDSKTDRTTPSGATNYTYNSPGTFQVTCTVVDNRGAATSSNPLIITITLKKKAIIRRPPSV